MAWGTVNVDDQRMKFVVSADRREKTMRELCAEFDISRPTGYEWLRRFQAGGIKGVEEKSRRPLNSPEKPLWRLKSVSCNSRAAAGLGRAEVAALARRRKDSSAGDHGTPDFVAARFGASAGSVPHRDATLRAARAEPVVADGFQKSGGMGRVGGPLSLLDDHSRYVIALDGTWSTKAEPVQQRLIEAFESCGVPEEMLMDHGTPWWNMKSAAGWTWLSVWIMRQGIQLHFSGYRHPQTQGKVERFHGALGAAMNRRGIPAGGAAIVAG